MKRLIYPLFRLIKIVYYKIYLKKHGLDRAKIIMAGLPQIIIRKGGILNICGVLRMVNTAKDATLGKPQKCKFLVYPNAYLTFKGDVSMSNTVIVATKGIEIGNNVMIGGGCTIVDSDFHSMNYNNWNTANDELNMLRSEVKIGDNVFIGMDSLILKGVTIGNGVVIAARSVITHDIPDNEYWGGNPAKFIKKRS